MSWINRLFLAMKVTIQQIPISFQPTWRNLSYNCTILYPLLLTNRYFEKVHPLFPIIHKDAFKTAVSQTSSKDIPNHLLWAVYLAASSFSSDARLEEGPSSRLEIEKHLKRARDRDLESGKSSDLSLIQSLLLGELFPAKRERKVALLSWTINGRAAKLALKRKLNVDPQKLGFEPEVAHARILTWWCVYIVDIWDAARRGRPPSLHEGEYDVPLPTLSDVPSDEEVYFENLVTITRFCHACYRSDSIIIKLQPHWEQHLTVQRKRRYGI
jgi:hypothetical protein